MLKTLSRLRRTSEKSPSPVGMHTQAQPGSIRPESQSHSSSHARRTSEDQLRIEDLAFRFGSAPESYDVANASSQVLWVPSEQGILHLHADRKTWHFPGGIIAGDESKPSIIAWLKQTAKEQRRTVAVYSVGVEDAPLFREAGFAVNKFGEEAMLDLGSLTWQGKPFEWVRRQTHFCKRNSLEVIEITGRNDQLLLSDELVAVFFDDLRGRVYSKPLRLLEGQFDPQSLGRRRLFIAFHPMKQRIEGFLVASPMENGTSWAFETYRKRKDATRGTIAYLFREVTDLLQRQGVQIVSLCLVPGRGIHLDRAAEADARVRWLLKMWYGRLNFLFNTAGQDYFKSRFRPRYVERFICVYPRNTLASIASFLKMSGALDISVRNLISELWLSTKKCFLR